MRCATSESATNALAPVLPVGRRRVGETCAVSATPDTNLMVIVALNGNAAQLAYLNHPERVVGWMRADWLYAPTREQREANARYAEAMADHLNPENFTLN